MTIANARAAGVAGRVDLWTGQLSALPFLDGVFDVVVSSRALHEIATADGRSAALAEVLRVLRPGGQFALVDDWYTRDCRTLERSGAAVGIDRRSLGWRFCCAGRPAVLITGAKASADVAGPRDCPAAHGRRGWRRVLPG